MFHIVLHQPEIPPNTGNVIRLCANTGAALHLVEPLGFDLDDRQLKRAGLDYHEYATLQVHASLDAALDAIASARSHGSASVGHQTRRVDDAADAALDAAVDVAVDAIHEASLPDAPSRVFVLSTRGAMRHDMPRYRAGDVFVFGSETRGLPQAVIDACPVDQRLRLPMRPGNRSLNLSNAVAVIAFEAWRQLGFEGGQ